ncbi:site-specific DNA-methyltransferase [uncultured Eubacterium sp.]|uniref:site-specific DNA-methyltransferase n=1 Tax=uncultured Eubacterium sp. TaxID=165185 RepID=UPI0028037A6B|nr:site-specific DNA-methyltransferase [uncultured Eubacterium sp.]
MDKLRMQTANKADENFKKLAEMFPNAVTETIDENGEVVRAIDKDVLMQEISCKVVDGNEERYQFTWPDKKNSVLLANAPINKTLRPCREKSVDFDNTENLYIEGDNLEVLKLLQETYLGKIKMIYIDPPYNTGNDFVYEDDFAQSTDEYLANSGQYDDEGNRLVKNLDSNGRFHTDWLNMIYPRLKLAKDLLSDDGVIFISIDDNEQENLKKCCDEVFGADNFISEFVWKSRQNKDNRNITGVSIDHEYIVCYQRTFGMRALKGGERKTEQYTNPDNDPRGPWASANMVGLLPADQRPNCHYDLINPETGINYGKPAMGWRYDRKTMAKLISEKRILWPDSPNGRPRKKSFLAEISEVLPGYSSVVGADIYTRTATAELNSLFENKSFDFPKPIELVKDFIAQASKSDSIILDFFSGSATTAHAVMQLNAEDGGNRKFIMVQFPEETDEKSEAYKAGYKNICEIGKERIRRAGNKILEEATQETADIAKYGESYEVDETMNKYKNLDVGFRVLKCDSSNMKDVYYNPVEYEPSLFSSLEDNIKEDRTSEDLLFQVMLDLGVLLSSKIEETTIAGKKVFNVEDNYLIACFDDNVTEEVITEIAKQKPYYFVMRDSSMANDSVATNFEQIFASYSPDTVRKVL